MKIGIIGSRRLPELMKKSEELIIHTPYGDVPVFVIKYKEHELYFISRHGKQENLPPHKVNYRGNIQALAASHVGYVLSISTVGSMKPRIKTGDFVIPHDFFDATKSRSYTFFDDSRVHVDMSMPFCSAIRTSLKQSCEALKGVSFHEDGVYLVTEGPRLETPAEIKFYASIADVVGMTLSPEVMLAREKNICYGMICLVCNMGAGLQRRLTAEEITGMYAAKESTITTIIKTTIERLQDDATCQCPSSLSRAVL